MPVERAQAAFVQSGNTEYVVGGYNTTSTNSVTNTTIIYDLKSMTASLGPDAPLKFRGANGATGSDGRIYVFGGRDAGNNVLSATQIYNPSNHTWILGPAIPIPVSSPATVAVGSSIYLIGGTTASTYTNAVQIFDTNAMTWSYGGVIPVPTAGAKAVALSSGMILTFGGMNATGASTDIFQYLFGWSIRGQMPSPLIYHGVSMGADGLIYVVGGVNNTGLIPATVDSSFCYDFAASQWTTLPKLPEPVQGTGMATTLDGRVIMFGGANATYEPKTTVEFLQVLSRSVAQSPPVGIQTGQSGFFSVTVTSTFRPLQKITGTYSLLNATGVVYATGDFSSVSGNTAVFQVAVQQKAPAGTYILNIKNGQAYFPTDTVALLFDNLSIPVTAAPSISDQIAAVETDLSTMRAAYEAELAGANANTSAQIEGLNANFTAQLADLNSNYSAQIAALNATQSAQAESLRQQIVVTQEALAQAQHQLDASRSQLNTTVDNTNAIASTVDKKADSDLVMIVILLAVLAITILAVMILVARKK